MSTVVNYDYEEYLNFSSTQHTVEEILERIYYKGSRSVCFSYLCRYCNIPEDKMEEFILISAIPMEKDPVILSLLKASYKEGLKYLKELLLSGEDKVRDRIDWFYLIRYQKENIPMDIFNLYCTGIERNHALDALRHLES